MKKNLPLILGIGLPIAFVVFIFTFVALPRIFGEKPQQDFVFTISNGYIAQCEYVVIDGTLVRKLNSTDFKIVDSYANPNPYGGSQLIRTFECSDEAAHQLYRWDAETESYEAVSYDAVSKLSLSGASRSRDGFEVRYTSREYSMLDFFGGGSRPARVEISKGNSVRAYFTVPDEVGWSYGGFKFIGWIND